MSSYVTLGRSGLRVSRLALGTMTFGTESGWGADEATAARLFDLYLDHGGNFVDTADLYTGGTSETFLGRFVKARGVRDKVVLATKYTFSPDPSNPNAGGNGRKNLLRALEGSLRRLQTDYVDLYMIHAWDLLTSPDEVLRTLDDQVRAGKVRHVALSDVPAWYASRMQTLAELRGLEPVSALQLEYSLVERNVEREHVPLALRHGMSLVAWSPLAGGLLSGKYRPSRGDAPPAGRLDVVRDSPNPVFHKLTDRNFAIVAELERVADEVGRPMAEVALSWTANRPGIASVLIGATKPEQLESNLRALDLDLPPELADRLERASRPEPQFPYVFFEGVLQGMVHGAHAIASKPPGYHAEVRFEPPPAS